MRHICTTITVGPDVGILRTTRDSVHNVSQRDKMTCRIEEERTMKIEESIPLYLDYRRSEGYKSNTVRADLVALRRVQKILPGMDLDHITPQHIDAIYTEMNERRLRPSTVNLSTAAMRSFFRWAIDRGYRTRKDNPVQGRRYRPADRQPQTRVPMSMFPALLDAATSPRDRALIALGLYTMARKTEITGIRISDLDLDSGEISLYISKTNTYDRRPICAELDAELRTWLTYYTSKVGPLEPDYYLVPATLGGPTSKGGGTLRPRKQMQSPEDAVHRALAGIGMPNAHHSGMHVLRRSAARAYFSELTAKGYDGALRQVSAWLNHKSTAMTEIYLGIELDRATRDAEAKGQVLFPSLSADNVVSLGVAHGEDRAVGV